MSEIKMSYQENLTKLHKLVVYNNVADSYKFEDGYFTVCKDGEIICKGNLHFVVENVEQMIPPTIDEAITVIRGLYVYLRMHQNMGLEGTVGKEARKMIDWYEMTNQGILTSI